MPCRTVLGQANFEAQESDLTLKTLRALRHCTTDGERVYALDWNHPCYYFDPHAVITDATRDSWAVPVLPNGDDFYYLALDLRFGILSRFNSRTICVFGKELLNAFAQAVPLVFQKVIRIVK
jgi:hypothetical protein